MTVAVTTAGWIALVVIGAFVVLPVFLAAVFSQNVTGEEIDKRYDDLREMLRQADAEREAMRKDRAL